MKCPQCSYVSLEKTPNFCSQCGCKLTSQSNETAADKPQDKSQTSSNIPHSTDVEMTDISHKLDALDNQIASVSPKRPNEDINPNPKKKKRKKKKKKAGVAEGPSSLTSDLSDISLDDKEKKMEEDQSSDSDGSFCTVDDKPKPAESSSHLSPPENQSTGPTPLNTMLHHAGEDQCVEKANSSEEICVTSRMSKKSKLNSTQEPISSSTASDSPAVSVGADKTTEKIKTKSKNKGQKSMSTRAQTTIEQTANVDQHANIKSSTGDQMETDCQDVEPLQIYSSSGDSVMVEHSKKQQSGHANQMNPESKKVNESGDTETNKDNPKKNQNEEPQKSSQEKVFGPQSKLKKNQSSSGKSSMKVEHSEKQQSAHANQMNTETKKDNQKKNQNEESQKSSQEKMFGPQSKLKKNQDSGRDAAVKAEQSQKQQSSHEKKDSVADQKLNQSDNTKSHCEVPPKRNPASAQHISSSDRLIIYFHAVLSKDFKFNLEEDRVFIRAGGCLGDWENNLVELSVSRDLGEHGFLVEGKFVCKKTSAEAVSIPYKYVVYKAKKQKYEFEYIYKLDSNETTNRCLFVKPRLLNDEGEWHQYDDIICVEPSKNMLKRLKDAFWPDQRKDVIQGREIAGSIMLETIFDLLRNWGKININSFFSQLRQFYEVYGNPFVFEKTEMKWYSLKYDEKDVSNLLKQFMLQNVTPELQKDSKERSTFIKEPLKAALIMLYVWKQYHLDLDSGTLSRLCTALCLPKLPKDEFLSFWTDIMESFSMIKNLSEMVEALILRVRAASMTRWIIVIPVLHLLKGTSKPFEPVFIKANPQYEQNWAGLQGLKSANITSTGSQDRRALLNLMETHRHLVEVDKLLARSWMYLMSVDELVECSSIIHAELLDILQLFTMKCPNDISFSTSTSVTDTLAHIQSHLLEQQYRKNL